MLKRSLALGIIVAAFLFAAICLSSGEGRNLIDDIVIVAGGDVLLGRGVRSSPEFAGDGAALFDAVAPFISSADFSFANLECSIAPKCECLPKKYCLHGDPEKVKGLQRVGFDLMTLANNHVYDCGREAIPFAIETLTANNMASAGAGNNMSEAIEPYFATIRGIRIGIIAVTTFPLEALSWNPELPTPAVSFRDEIADEIKKARTNADVLILSIHWGKEYSPFASDSQEDIAAAASQAGADIIIGHHPHVIEPCIKLDKTWVAYSLGNLLFDSYRPETKLSALMKISIDPITREIGVEFIPLEIQKCKPIIASGEAMRKIVRVLNPPQGEPMWEIDGGIIKHRR